MRAPPPSSAAIVRVDNFDAWFFVINRGRPNLVDGSTQHRMRLHAVLPGKESPLGYYFDIQCAATDDEQVATIRHLYDMSIGHVGCVWAKEGVPIAYRHANVTFGDLFDFYSTAEGVLELPKWCSMRFAVDQFLREDPRIKFHPSRVEQFIADNGIDHLEMME